MQLVITLRKEVQNRDEGDIVFDEIKEHLKDQPDIKVTGHVTNHFIESEDPS